MSVTFEIVVSKETKDEDDSSEKEFIKDLKKLKHEKRKIFTDAGTAKAGIVEPIIIAVVSSLIAEVIKKNAPDAIEATRNIVRQIFTTARAKGKNVKVVLKGRNSKPIEFLNDSDTELDSKLKAPT